MSQENELTRLRVEREKIALEKERLELAKLQNSITSAEKRRSQIASVVQRASNPRIIPDALCVVLGIFFGIFGLFFTVGAFWSDPDDFLGCLVIGVLSLGGATYFFSRLKKQHTFSK